MRTRMQLSVFGLAMGLLLLGWTLGAASDAAPVSSRIQRMLIGVGCYRIPAHSSGLAPAFCLDQAADSPRRGMMLDQSPALGQASLMADGKVLSFEAALAQHLIRVEGADAADQVTLVNTGNRAVSICVGQPVVVMGNGVTYSRDLVRIYDRITALMRSLPAATDDPDRHAKLQQALWHLVDETDEAELAAAWPLPGRSKADDESCTARSNTTVLCR